MTDELEETRHPSFVLADSLPEPWRSHFPKSPEEARVFKPMVQRFALDSRVLVVAHTRVECAWCAYCGAVEGWDHRVESNEVLERGTKLPEEIARCIFKEFGPIPYAH